MARAPRKAQSSTLTTVAAVATDPAVEKIVNDAAQEAATEVPDGYTHTHNSGGAGEVNQTKAEVAAKAKAVKLAAKEAKTKEVEAAKAEKKAAREQAKIERQAALAELAEGKGYTGSMLALADKVKSGVYVKSATGQLRCDDELANALDTVPPSGVIKLAKALELPGEYGHLNVGQQSMNYRNRMRGALKKATITMEGIKTLITELDLDAGPEIAARAKAVADSKAARAAKLVKEPAEVEA